MRFQIFTAHGDYVPVYRAFLEKVQFQRLKRSCQFLKWWRPSFSCLTFRLQPDGRVSVHETQLRRL